MIQRTAVRRMVEGKSRNAEVQLKQLRNSLEASRAAANASEPWAPAKSSRSQEERRAVVGCLLRKRTPETLESLFILRAITNVENRWSGQVAWPGGHVEVGETDEVALFREMKEEVGLDLRDGDGVHYLGAIESMPITRRSTGALLQLSCRVYFLESDVLATGPTKPQDDEVAACCWCPLDVVCNLDKREPYGGSEMWKDFPCVRLPTPYAFLTLSDRASEKWTIATIRRKFKLWGLTLAMADQLLTSADLLHGDWSMHSASFYQEAKERGRL